MKVLIYKKATRKKVGELLIESRQQVVNFIKDNPNNGFFYLIDGESQPVVID